MGTIYKENLNLDFENKHYVMIGKYMEDDSAFDFIHLNQNIYSWFKLHLDIIEHFNGTIIEVIKSNEDCIDYNYLKIPDDLKDASVWMINASDNSVNSMQDLVNVYLKHS